MVKETIVYKNDLNLVPLRNFTPVEIDLFFVMCNKLKEQGTRKILIDFKELKHLSNYYTRSLDRFTQDLTAVYDKMLNLTYSRKSEHSFEKFVLFTSYKVNTHEQYLELAINPDLMYILNSITGEFTKFEIAELSKLKSSYSKNMFRLLKQYKHTGFLKLDIDDFKERLDIPTSYKMNDINKRVIKPIENELSPLFHDFKIDKIKAKKSRKIGAIEFSFTPELKGQKAYQRQKGKRSSQFVKSREKTPKWLKDRDKQNEIAEKEKQKSLNDSEFIKARDEFREQLEKDWD
ncbi:TPA: RepB family plasmid replication initiator protein [Staphylococcus aureus]|nr:RepB family plasmid replication initiator protein [Staphylococcus aureus]